MIAIFNRVALFAIAMGALSACYDIYYQPAFENFPDKTYALPYDRDVIPADGDTCWFNYYLEKEYIAEVFSIIDSISCDFYYSNIDRKSVV